MDKDNNLTDNGNDADNTDNINVINIPLLSCPACNSRLILDVVLTKEYRVLENDDTAMAFRCEKAECGFVKIILKSKEQKREL